MRYLEILKRTSLPLTFQILEGIQVDRVDLTKFKNINEIEKFVNQDPSWLRRLHYFNWKNISTPPDDFYKSSRQFFGNDEHRWRYKFHVPSIITKGNDIGDFEMSTIYFNYATLQEEIKPDVKSFNDQLGIVFFPTITRIISSFMQNDKKQIESEKHFHTNHYYIRFGKWKPNEQSLNHLTNELEKGVSCYNTRFDTDTRKWSLETDVDPDTITGTMEGLISDYVEKNKKMYLVTGDHIGNGSDDEPLLKNLKIIKELTLNDISIDNIYDDDDLAELESQRHETK